MKYPDVVLGSVEATAVVTVSYNSDEQLDAFLSSLDNEIRAGGMLVVIADNASSDIEVTERIARTHGSQVVTLSENLGYGGAANAGVAVLDPAIRWILVINPDVVLGAGSIDAMLAPPTGIRTRARSDR